MEASASSELYALLKREDEKAVTERAYRAGSGMRTFGAVYEPIASDPRFATLLESMGLSR